MDCKGAVVELRGDVKSGFPGKNYIINSVTVLDVCVLYLQRFIQLKLNNRKYISAGALPG